MLRRAGQWTLPAPSGRDHVQGHRTSQCTPAVVPPCFPARVRSAPLGLAPWSRPLSPLLPSLPRRCRPSCRLLCFLAAYHSRVPLGRALRGWRGLWPARPSPPVHAALPPLPVFLPPVVVPLRFSFASHTASSPGPSPFAGAYPLPLCCSPAPLHSPSFSTPPSPSFLSACGLPPIPAPLPFPSSFHPSPSLTRPSLPLPFSSPLHPPFPFPPSSPSLASLSPPSLSVCLPSARLPHPYSPPPRLSSSLPPPSPLPSPSFASPPFTISTTPHALLAPYAHGPPLMPHAALTLCHPDLASPRSRRLDVALPRPSRGGRFSSPLPPHALMPHRPHRP